MDFTYGQLERTLTAHLNIEPDKEQTFRSRMKQLQRMEFPSGVNVGRGAKMSYTVEHLFKLAIAFELIGAGVPSLPATQFVEKQWHVLAGAIGLAAIADREFIRSSTVFAEISVRGLYELQFDPNGAKVQAFSATIMDSEEVVFRFNMKTRSRYYSCLLGITDLFIKISETAKNSAGVTISPYDPLFNLWLPKGEEKGFLFRGRYPDRSNIKMRQRLQFFYGNDPEASTPEGAAEANEFVANGFSSTAPF